jgi:hypothetical protein
MNPSTVKRASRYLKTFDTVSLSLLNFVKMAPEQPENQVGLSHCI